MKQSTSPSTKRLNQWVKIKCKECGGHGGGHFECCKSKGQIK
jgi:hypothetical protein